MRYGQVSVLELDASICPSRILAVFFFWGVVFCDSQSDFGECNVEIDVEIHEVTDVTPREKLSPGWNSSCCLGDERVSIAEMTPLMRTLL